MAARSETRDRLRFVIPSVDIDWQGVVLACSVRDVAWLGVAFVIAAIALRVVGSRRLTIDAEGDGVYVAVTRWWQWTAPQRSGVENARLEHWTTWSSRGARVVGSNLQIAFCMPGSRPIRAMAGLAATQVPPPRRHLSGRTRLLALPNALLGVGVMVATYGRPGVGFFAFFFGLVSVVTAIATSLRGGPRLSVLSSRES